MSVWGRATDMLMAAGSAPANMIDMRMAPASDSQACTSVLLPVSMHRVR